MGTDPDWREALTARLTDARPRASAHPTFEAPAFHAVRPRPSVEPPPDSPTPRARGRHRMAVSLALVLVAVVAGGAAGWVAGDQTSGDANPAVAQTSPGRVDVAALSQATEPAIVLINTERAGRSQRAQGSGIVLTDDGEVLTNAHVVQDATDLTVTVPGRPDPLAARVVAVDPASDIALVRVDGVDDLRKAAIGRSARLRVGHDIVAIGYALGFPGRPSVTRGIVSALDRSIETAGGPLTGLVQTDTAISSGSSGGALLNTRGEVVGITTAVATGGVGVAVQNVAFAIPIDQALQVVDLLRQG